MKSNSKDSPIGFMQGRLSPLIEGKIQSFPWPYWQQEFTLAQQNGFHLMEWTLDQERLPENPLMTEKGRQEIKALMAKHQLAIKSLTGDCFMQAPFYKVLSEQREGLLEDLANIIKSCADVGIRIVLIPLVDAGRLENRQQEKALLEGLATITPLLNQTGVMVSFESDLPPDNLARFIDNLNERYFGLTYDIGNSAALGYDPEEELAAYGPRVVNVHVKDRKLGGTTVPLGTGNANIPKALAALQKAGYHGNYILQTARATNGDHAGVLCTYRDMMADWLGELVA